MNKKFLMLTCAAALLIGINSVRAVEEEPITPPPAAEKAMSRDDMHKMRAEKFAQELGLTEEQRKKAEEIRKADFERDGRRPRQRPGD